MIRKIVCLLSARNCIINISTVKRILLINCSIYIFLKILIAMDPATLSTIILFCDSDHNILKKRGKFVYVWTCAASKNKCTTASFWKSSSFPKESFL